MADNNDDYKVRNYQDEVDNDADARDKVTEELTDDPTKELGVPPRELATEEEHYDFENGENDESDDRREEIEDDDEETSDNAD